jgi:hypothetical protein
MGPKTTLGLPRQESYVIMSFLLCWYHNGPTMSPKDRATYFSMPQGLPFCPAALVSRI